MVTNRSGYEHYDYMHVDALADLLEELGVIWADEPKVLAEGQPPTESWSYKLPDGTVSGRDSRWLAADDIRRHYTHKMFGRESSEHGLARWQNWNDADPVNVYDPFQNLRRALAKAEIYAFCRPKDSLPQGWATMFKSFFEAVQLVLDMFNRYLKDPHPTERPDRQETAKLGEKLDRRKDGAIFFIEEIAKSTDQRGLREDYFRTSRILDAIYYIIYPLRWLMFAPNKDEPE